MQYSKLIFFSGWLIIFLIRCSTTDDTRFLIDNLDNKEKSDLLTEKGLALYKAELEQKENYGEIGRVKQYFEAALRFDPANNLAKTYLSKTESYVHDIVTSKIKAAKDYLKKRKRTEEDNYRLAVNIANAAELEPENSEIRAIRDTAETIINGLMDKYLKTARAEKNLINKNDSIEKKESVLVTVLDYYDRIILVSGDTGSVRAERDDVVNALYSILENRIDSAEKKLHAGRFQDSERELVSISGLDTRLSNHFEKQRNDLAYDLYYSWSGAYVRAKNFKAAEVTINRALSIRKTAEAYDLKAKIDRTNNEDKIASQFSGWLNEIDSAIDRRNYADAYWKIKNVRARISDTRRIELVRNRESRIEGLVPQLYDSAIQLYQAESFREAIELLEVVLDAKGTYKDARAYIDRARQKQSVLDTYGGEDSSK
jgi:hypothetical protein